MFMATGVEAITSMVNAKAMVTANKAKAGIKARRGTHQAKSDKDGKLVIQEGLLKGLEHAKIQKGFRRMSEKK